MSAKSKILNTRVLSIVFACAGLAACADVGENGEDLAYDDEVGESEQAQVCSSPANTIFGSDTLKPGVDPVLPAGLVYGGTGSGNGENSMRGIAISPCTAPAGRFQCFAPMSRDFTGGSCHPNAPLAADNFKSRPVALDAVLAVTKNGSAVAGVTADQLALAFCKSSPKVAGECPATVGTFTKFYRRDNVSGTTDTFKTLVAAAAGIPAAKCAAICDSTDNANIVTVDESTRNTVCAAGTASDKATATKCIGYIAGVTTNSLGYAGLSAKLASSNPKVLPVAKDDNNPPAAEPFVTADADHIRGNTALSIPAFSYPLTRFLFKNYNLTMLGRATSTTNVQSCHPNERLYVCKNVLGSNTGSCAGALGSSAVKPTGSTLLTAENALVAADFLACKTTGVPMDCNSLSSSFGGPGPALACP